MEISEYRKIDELEQTYWWYIGLKQLVLAYVSEKAEFSTEKLKILDAGCGTGWMFTALEKYGEVTAFDYSDEAITICQEKGLSMVSKIDINDWIGEEASYDLIISLDVLYHKDVLEVNQVVTNFQKALKKDGVLILNLPAYPILRRSHDRKVHGDKRFKKKQLKSILVNAGFRQNFLSYRMPFIFLIIYCQKLIGLNKTTSDLNELHPFVNKFLCLLMKLENFFIKNRLPMLFGSSIFSVSKKN